MPRRTVLSQPAFRFKMFHGYCLRKKTFEKFNRNPYGTLHNSSSTSASTVPSTPTVPNTHIFFNVLYLIQNRILQQVGGGLLLVVWTHITCVYPSRQHPCWSANEAFRPRFFEMSSISAGVECRGEALSRCETCDMHTTYIISPTGHLGHFNRCSQRLLLLTTSALWRGLFPNSQDERVRSRATLIPRLRNRLLFIERRGSPPGVGSVPRFDQMRGIIEFSNNEEIRSSFARLTGHRT